MPSIADRSPSLEPETFAARALESRVNPRVAVDIPAALRSAGFSHPLQARTRDLSIGGVCLATRTPVALSEIQRVELEVDGERLVLDAEGRWQSPDSGDKDVLTSVQFCSVSPDARSTLNRALSKSMTGLTAFLGRSAIGGVTEEEHAGLAQVTRYRKVSGGSYVYQESAKGGSAGALFLVRDGSVALEVRLGGTRNALVAKLGPGQLFGGLGVPDVPCFDSAYAERDTTLVEISSGAIAYLRMARPLLAHHFFDCVVRSHTTRLRAFHRQLGGGSPAPARRLSAHPY